MKIEYAAVLSWDPADAGYTVTFPDAPGCVTEADTETGAAIMAREALTGWLATQLKHDHAQPPTTDAHTANDDVSADKVVMVSPSRRVALAAWLRFQRAERGWTQAEAARRLEVSQSTYAGFENPDANLRMDTIERLERLYGEPVLAI